MRPNEQVSNDEARQTIRGWIADPALWVIVVDRSFAGWLRQIGDERYRSELRERWFQVLIFGPVLVASMAKSEMTRADLKARFSDAGGTLADEDPNDAEAFSMMTPLGERETEQLALGFAHWLTGTQAVGCASGEDAPSTPRRIRRRHNPLRQRR